MSIYKQLLEAVKEGKTFRINLKEKSLLISKKIVIQNGQIKGKNDEPFIEETDLKAIPELDGITDSWEVVSKLHGLFNHSVPDKKWRGNLAYFSAYEMDELSEAELAFGIDRTLAQAMLEGYILCASLQGMLTWSDESRWFWQDPSNPECIVLKDWAC